MSGAKTRESGLSDTGKTLNSPPASPVGVRRAALMLVGLVWPLIWVGGLVTTYDAGMAVPDWPGTYGYNLFLYPYQTWLFGPFDLMIEHGHRLLGAVVGLVAIFFFVLALWQEDRTWVKWFAGFVLLAVIGQGLLGGMRVRLGDRTLAMVHGCTGPLFFATCVGAACVSGRWWTAAADRSRRTAPTGRLVLALAFVVTGLSYTQLVFGAQLRHVQPTAPPSSFAMTTALHISVAFVLWGLVGWKTWTLRRCGDLSLYRPSQLLLGSVTLQISLGIATWVVNYGFPDGLRFFPGAENFLVRSKGFWDSLIVTSHVATGSLILALAVMILIRVLRLRHAEIKTAQ